MKTITFTTHTVPEVPEHILEAIVATLTAEEVKKLITVKEKEEKEVIITVPERVKTMKFETTVLEFTEYHEEVFTPVLAKVEELTVEEALEILVETPHITYEEFKEVLFKVAPETEITKQLLKIFTEIIETTKEERTTEKVHKLLKTELIKFFEEDEVLTKHKFLIPHFEKYLADFVEILKPEYFFFYDDELTTKDVAMKEILLKLLTIIEQMFSYY